MCNDRELSCIERVKLVQTLQYMRSVALPNLPLSSPVLIQKITIRISQKNTIFNNFTRFIDITNKTGFIYTKTGFIIQFRRLEYMPISLLNRINKL